MLERVGPFAYKVALPPCLSGKHDIFHVAVLRKYVFDPAQVLDFSSLESTDDMSYEERPLQILACETKELRNRVIPYVKVLWSNHEEHEATWEREAEMLDSYLFLF